MDAKAVAPCNLTCKDFETETSVERVPKVLSIIEFFSLCK